MSYFNIQFHCTLVGKPAHWCHCCVTHAIGSRDMPAVNTTFHFASNSSCGLIKNILFSDTSRSFDCECYCLKRTLFYKKTITWGYINIVFYSRIFPRTPFTNGRPSNNFFSVAVSFTQKIVCYATRNNALYITQSLVTFEVLHALADGVLSIQLAHWNLNQYFPVKHMKPSSTFRTIPISLHPHSAQFR